MSILDSLIFGIRSLWVNGVEQPDKGAIEFSGAGVSVSQVGNKNVVSISGTGSGGGNTTAEYVLTTADGTLPNSRVLTGSTGLSVTNTSGATTLACVYGTTAGTGCVGNDSRLSDSRTPTAHTASHKHGGTDEIATATAAANAIPKAGATGTLAVNWLPTGTSSATVCIGNDVRIPASNPSAGTAGQCVVSDGSRVVYRGDVGRWWNSGVTPTSTAMAADTIEAFGFTRLPEPGQPVRILDSTGMIYNNVEVESAPIIISADAITGLKGSLLDHRGRLWFKLVVTSSPTCRFDIYNNETYASAALVGHTNTFTGGVIGNQTLTITADNGSGLGGTFVVDPHAGVLLAVHSVQFMRTSVVSRYNVDEGLLVFRGQYVTMTAGAIKEIWFGAPELVVVMHGQIVGPYAPETTSTALLNRNADSLTWLYGASTIADVRAKHLVNDTGATQPMLIPVIDGVQMVADGSAIAMKTDFDALISNATPESMRIERRSAIEFRTIAGTNGNARNAIFDIIAVLD